MTLKHTPCFIWRVLENRENFLQFIVNDLPPFTYLNVKKRDQRFSQGHKNKDKFF